MNQLEIIRIRLFSASDFDQVSRLIQQIKETFKEGKGQNMRIALLKNKKIENDWSIHLSALNGLANREVSTLACLLTEIFRPIGMVNHDEWEPIEMV